MEKEKLFNFTKKFFESLHCSLEWEGKILTVRNAPEAFENLLRKKSPYYLAFESSHLNNRALLVAQGEEILKAMTDYLKKSASTTLLKINFEADPKKIIADNFHFRNSELTESRNDFKNDFFYRFTFQTNFTYLNKKEQVINEIYIHDNKVVQGNLSGYAVEEGRKEDVSSQEIEKNYALAKIRVKELAMEKTEEIGAKLNEKLEAEIKRIEEYFGRQKKEADDRIQEEEERIRQAEKDIGKGEKNREETISRIEKAKKSIAKIREENNPANLKKEQEMAINDAKHKCSLNIENDLINSTVIYYPIFTFYVNFDRDIKKRLQIKYNPLTGELGKIECSKCLKKIKEINFCSNGHPICSDCVRKCSSCGKAYCLDCLKFKCKYCGARLCKNCYFRCRNCGKLMCKKHLKKDSLTGDEGCTACLKPCPECSQFSSPKFFKKNSQGKLACQKCTAKEAGKNITKDLFL